MKMSDDKKDKAVKIITEKENAMNKKYAGEMGMARVYPLRMRLVEDDGKSLKEIIILDRSLSEIRIRKPNKDKSNGLGDCMEAHIYCYDYVILLGGTISTVEECSDEWQELSEKYEVVW